MDRLLFPYQWNIYKMTRNGNSYSFCEGNRSIKIALIDSGIDYKHPALKDNIDLVSSYNFSSDSDDIIDNDGHGTMVAGMICANGDLLGISPQVSLIVCKITESRKFKLKQMYEALKHAINCGVDVINLSLSVSLDINNTDVVPIFNEIIAEAKRRNIAIVTSSGNQNIDLDTKYKLHIPGFNPYVIVVGATNKLGVRAGYSNYGAIDYVAPGGDWAANNPDFSEMIVTTYPTYINDMNPIRVNLGLPKGYTVDYGTSLSCAQVSGTIGLIISYILQLTNKKPNIDIIKHYLQMGVLNKSKNDKFMGEGEINVYNTLKLIHKDYSDYVLNRK